MKEYNKELKRIQEKMENIIKNGNYIDERIVVDLSNDNFKPIQYFEATKQDIGDIALGIMAMRYLMDTIIKREPIIKEIVDKKYDEFKEISNRVMKAEDISNDNN